MLYIGLSNLRKSKDKDGALEKMYTISSNSLDKSIYRKKQLSYGSHHRLHAYKTTTA